MHLPSCLAALTTFTLLASAAPAQSDLPTRSTSCMTKQDATKVASNFKALINQNFSTPLARAAMTPDFIDYSDSVNELINAGCTSGPKTLTEPTFGSRTAFINGQSGQPPIPFEILNIWNTCTEVIMRWRTSAPGPVVPEQPVTGIVVMETTPNTGDGADEQPWLMKTVYSEFNSGAWLYDVGNGTAGCPNANTRRSSQFASRSVNLRPGFDGPARLF